MEEFFTGTVAPFPYNFVPRGWLPCNGQPILISQYTQLYALIGNIYGGDTRAVFNLPNLNANSGQPARIVAGQGDGRGLTPRQIGSSFGSDSVTLTSDQMPPHVHGFGVYKSGANMTKVPAPGDTVTIADSNGYVPTPIPSPTTFSPQAIEASGTNQPHDNVQPVLDFIYCICVDGVFPQFD